MASRHLLALVAGLAFGLSAGTPTLMHGCAHAQSAALAGAPAHHHSDEPETPAPDDECRCVGHSCCTMLVVAPPAPAGATASGPRAYRASAVPDVAPRGAAPHLLPFANGPPAPLLS
ncbi:MAG: hypothetical protein MUC69_05625 [Gemmatimonadales bacterium]|nr:hypothetical protein [Gemmatimonadales bacterium]